MSESISDSACGKTDHCQHPAMCPLSQIRAGVAVRIKQLAAAPDVNHRLREMGFCEEQAIRLIRSENNIICQVCNVRLGISPELAQTIMVEPLAGGSRPR